MRTHRRHTPACTRARAHNVACICALAPTLVRAPCIGLRERRGRRGRARKGRASPALQASPLWEGKGRARPESRASTTAWVAAPGTPSPPLGAFVSHSRLGWGRLPCPWDPSAPTRAPPDSSAALAPSPLRKRLPGSRRGATDEKLRMAESPRRPPARAQAHRDPRWVGARGPADRLRLPRRKGAGRRHRACALGPT